MGISFSISSPFIVSRIIWRIIRWVVTPTGISPTITITISITPAITITVTRITPSIVSTPSITRCAPSVSCTNTYTEANTHIRRSTIPSSIAATIFTFYINGVLIIVTFIGIYVSKNFFCILFFTRKVILIIISSGIPDHNHFFVVSGCSVDAITIIISLLRRAARGKTCDYKSQNHTVKRNVFKRSNVFHSDLFLWL